MAKVNKRTNSLPQPSSWPEQYVHPSDDKKNQDVIVQKEITPAVMNKATEPAASPIASAPMPRQSVTERLIERQAQANYAAQQAEQNYNTSRKKFEQYQADYVSGQRNAVADMITKPKRDEAKEKRLKQVAIVSLITDALGLIGKGYAASRGIRPTVTEGVGSMRAMSELRRLDDLYQQEGRRYDQQNILDTLRRQKTEDDIHNLNLSVAREDMISARAKADAVDKLIYAQQISDEERAYKEQVRKEDNTRADKRHAQQLAANRGSSEQDDYSRNVKMVIKDPITGKKVPIYDGNYSQFLNTAISENPGLKNEIEMAQTYNMAALSGLCDRIVLDQYTKQRKAGKFGHTGLTDLTSIVKTDAASLKKNGQTMIAIVDLRSDLGNIVDGVSDDEVIKQYKQHGVTVTK